MKQDTYDFGSEPKCIRLISVLSQPEYPLARCLKVFCVLNDFSSRFHSPHSVAQPESALFVETYANVSASSARSHQLYQNANVFGLERSFSSAPKVQQLDICIQRRSRSQANGRSDFRISARPPNPKNSKIAATKLQFYCCNFGNFRFFSTPGAQAPQRVHNF